MDSKFLKTRGMLNIIFVITGISGILSSHTFAGYWDPQFDINGINGPVHTLKANQNFVCVGGEFSQAGQVSVNHIAFWEDEQWKPLSTGCDSTVHTIALDGENVYVGGCFTTAGDSVVHNIAVWDGQYWHPLGQGVDGDVYAIAVDNQDVYVGGNFDHAGDVSANNIARWDGDAWHALEGGVDFLLDPEDAAVYDLLVMKNNLIVGGKFDQVDSLSIHNIAYWNGIAWNSFQDGFKNINWYLTDQHVQCLSTDGNNIFTGTAEAHHAQEYFDGNNVCCIHYADVYQWDGFNWTGLGSAIYGYEKHARIYTMKFSTNTLYIAGQFIDQCVLIGDYPDYHSQECPNINARFIAKWDSSRWDTLQTTVNGPVYAMDVCDGKIWVGGNFTSADTVLSHNLGCFIESSTPVPENVNAGIQTKNILYLRNYPNPFNATTSIFYELAQKCRVTLSVFDVRGRLIQTILDHEQTEGEYHVSYQVSDLPSGIYFYQLETQNEQTHSVKSKKMLLLR